MIKAFIRTIINTFLFFFKSLELLISDEFQTTGFFIYTDVIEPHKERISLVDKLEKNFKTAEYKKEE